jgi:hypothetical protein
MTGPCCTSMSLEMVQMSWFCPAGRPKALRVNDTGKPHPLTMHPGTVLPPK